MYLKESGDRGGSLPQPPRFVVSAGDTQRPQAATVTPRAPLALTSPSEASWHVEEESSRVLAQTRPKPSLGALSGVLPARPLTRPSFSAVNWGFTWTATTMTPGHCLSFPRVLWHWKKVTLTPAEILGIIQCTSSPFPAPPGPRAFLASLEKRGLPLWLRW